ncbi:MAG TPA: DUF1330 domain-containing protein [Solirubrobacteraceae bacterium]
MPVNPTQEQLAEVAAIAGSADDRPVIMLNLNTYRERAAYDGEPPGGASADVSGREAYERYGAVAQGVLAREGGRILWHTRSPGFVIGAPGEGCDEVIAVEYPSHAAFLALALDQEILPALAHRNAGLERAVIIRCEPGLGAA